MPSVPYLYIASKQAPFSIMIAHNAYYRSVAFSQKVLLASWYRFRANGRIIRCSGF
ncbi:hypothetical protein D3C75_1357350 [compost metagenome]